MHELSNVVDIILDTLDTGCADRADQNENGSAPNITKDLHAAPVVSSRVPFTVTPLTDTIHRPSHRARRLLSKLSGEEKKLWKRHRRPNSLFHADDVGSGLGFGTRWVNRIV
ncbi:hypothetical protein Pdw03_3605 [Penicillium digitatum]|uniref:Uncharacterized protein n=1 Tax=Penicillium digitatum TaxID=36651 RepID=A0A7T6XGM8_PENDI|nr:hypothetical protein Pdw03_3605 [Penicillium digitatum]